MKTAFADTFYWVALAHPKDQWHDQAIRICAELEISRIVTTDEVLTEFLTQLGSYGPNIRNKAAVLVKAVMADPNIRVLAQSRGSFRAGLSLYEARPDKSYSMTDCISMAAMRAEGLTDVLTYDEHFIQEGFTALFRP